MLVRSGKINEYAVKYIAGRSFSTSLLVSRKYDKGYFAGHNSTKSAYMGMNVF
ncbi:hypothetical protein Plhal304r1_c025g0086251 [Plasmopara halstedii]